MKVLYWSLVIVVIDQITKLKVKGINIPWLGIHVEGMPYQSSIKVIGDFFQFTFIENPGMAFGLQLGSKLFLTLFTIFATILIFFIIYKNRNESYLLRIALAFILGGAMGNLIDRTFYGVIYDYAPLFYGRVVDFFHFDIPDFRLFGKTVYTFPIFNVADIAVTAGFILILLGYKKAFKEDKKEDASKNELVPADMQFAAAGAGLVIASDNSERGNDNIENVDFEFINSNNLNSLNDMDKQQEIKKEEFAKNKEHFEKKNEEFEIKKEEFETKKENFEMNKEEFEKEKEIRKEKEVEKEEKPEMPGETPLEPEERTEPDASVDELENKERIVIPNQDLPGLK